MSATSLLDPGFLRELEALRRFLVVGRRGGQSGAVTSRKRGGAAEFEEHRAYGPGDDAARLDWLAYARTGQPFLKVYRADEDAIVRVVVDASASMAHGAPSKFAVATRIAGALAYMALASSERASVLVASGEALATSPMRRGKGAVTTVFRDLANAVPSGEISLAATVAKATAGRGRPGLLVVVSDFLDRGPTFDALRRARSEGHELMLAQVLSPDELAPEAGGDFSLVDAETGEALDVTLDRATLLGYRARVEALLRELGSFATSQGGTYCLARTTDELAAVMRRLVGTARKGAA